MGPQGGTKGLGGGKSGEGDRRMEMGHKETWGDTGGLGGDGDKKGLQGGGQKGT